MIRINKIYTKAGDQGKTQVIGGNLSKNHPRLEACGTIDELNAWVGCCRTTATANNFSDISNLLEKIQHQLFDLGAELATVDAERLRLNKRILPESITTLEQEIDRLTDSLPELKSFVLPGGTALNSYLHIARTICRRAERNLWQLAAQPEELIPENAGIYLNRLSDLLFALARTSSSKTGTAEFLWKN